MKRDPGNEVGDVFGRFEFGTQSSYHPASSQP